MSGCAIVTDNETYPRPHFLRSGDYYILPHIILFLGHGGDFVGYLLGGEFDIVHECLLCLVAADMHHLEDGVPVAEIHRAVWLVTHS